MGMSSPLFCMYAYADIPLTSCLANLSSTFDMTVYERQSHVGGRLQNLVVDDIVTELGGAIAMKTNHYFYNMTRTLGLEYSDPPHAGRSMGVFLGPSNSGEASQWAFLESEWKLLNLYKMFRR
jgi:monoamine oxidase